MSEAITELSLAERDSPLVTVKARIAGLQSNVDYALGQAEVYERPAAENRQLAAAHQRALAKFQDALKLLETADA